jgi:hypothetical protein
VGTKKPPFTGQFLFIAILFIEIPADRVAGSFQKGKNLAILRLYIFYFAKLLDLCIYLRFATGCHSSPPLRGRVSWQEI